MGIEPHFNLWNYFFRVQLWSDSDVEAVVLAAQTSISALGRELTHTSASRYPTYRLYGGKCGSS
jgi:hypothetical protein